jgi:hypothetical protein
MKLSKRVKIAGILVVVALVAFVAFMAFAGSDVMSNLATGSETIVPDGAAAGKALVVYDPGLSGAPKEAAAKIANDLKTNGYEVVLAGVKSGAASNVSGYGIIVAGGPVYGGKVSGSIWSYLLELTPPANAEVGAFAIGEGNISPFPDAVPLKATVLLSSPDKSVERTAFVGTLLQYSQA